ncbi:c-type cytochrome biogenesis protein CcmI [Rubellimicrobium roseum]|uniref:C-type cytochrome biogenesis protein CcmI n=1 Tax=Rubellimicrobium roseum TaxID=687525 RepID=A0A5C4NBR3_9RHOB|nr:c-type cytochrome biogenesis protein CcmI [Rubellimicrobium roseum]TNC63221.1 c-type cytochrome biogenesis protein CcmI [Rubellimicrobium roseum]
MLFWIVAGTLAAVVAALLVRPLLAPPPAGAAESPDAAIYRDQLAEVDRDLARGTLGPAEAERARTEIARRLLAADRAGPLSFAEAPRRAGVAVAAVAAGLVVLGSLLAYSALGRPGAGDTPLARRLAEAQALRDQRPSQAEAEAQAAGMFAEPEAPAEYLEMVEELRHIVPERGDDLTGWTLLADHEARLGRYADAARAQARVIAIKGGEATAADHLGLVDRMVAAAGGIVTPEAEAALADLAALDTDNLGLLYYLGLLEAQTGRPDRAFPLWRKVVEEAAPDSLHHRLASGQIVDVAWLAGVDYEPPAGPSDADMAAAQEMDPESREQMIRGMVDGLASRLASEGGPPADWARLITSLAVLGETERAGAILAEARSTFAGNPEAEALLDQAATQAGLDG